MSRSLTDVITGLKIGDSWNALRVDEQINVEVETKLMHEEEEEQEHNSIAKKW
jgi:hypothetical protein